MAFTYDPTTDAGKVRLLVPDRDEQNVVYADAEIDAFLAIEGDVLRATALALETAGSDLVLTLRVTRNLGLEVDGAAAGRELRLRADVLRKRADAADEDAAAGDAVFDVAEWVIEPFGARERLHAERLRA
jgi:hypothetical protein